MSDDVVELDVIAPAEGKRWVERSRNCQFYAVNQAALHLADLIKCRRSTERTQTPESVDIAHQRAIVLDPLENTIGRIRPFGVLNANRLRSVEGPPR